MGAEAEAGPGGSFLGIDVGGTTTTLVIVDTTGRMLDRDQIDTLAAEGWEAVLGRVASACQALVRRVGDAGSPVAAGAALPGVVDMEQGVSLSMTNLPGNWPGVPVGSILSGKLGLPVYILNDGRAATWGESRFGAGRGARNMVMLTIGTGIGGGIVVEDDLYLGSKGWGGEVGHITVELHGPRCACGNYGCVESLASGPAIATMGIRAIKQGFTTLLRDLSGGDLNRVTPETVARAAGMGDVVAFEIMEQAGHYIGTAVSSLMVVLNPELVVIGGGVAKAGRLLFEPIERVAMIRSSVFAEPGGGARIVPAALGEHAGAIGSAAWAMRKSSVSPKTD